MMGMYMDHGFMQYLGSLFELKPSPICCSFIMEQWLMWIEARKSYGCEFKPPLRCIGLLRPTLLTAHN